MEESAYIVLRDIDKSFGSVHANRRVSLCVKKGEIHALLGENGSGKSTLVNMLAGIYAPDNGQIFIDGKETHFTSPREAIDKGIGMVHQHFKLVDVLSAKENIVLGRPGGVFLNTKAVTKQISALGEKQTVEILKILYRGADVLILDEPTAVLTPQETEALFTILRNMKKECAIIIITHKMHEVLSVSDRVSVLRKGECIGTVNTCKTNARELTEMMVGRPISLEIERPELKSELKKELCEIIARLRKASDGTVTFQGKSILGMSPREMTKQGIRMSFIPEDRLGMGLVGGLDIVDNILLKSFRCGKGSLLDRTSGNIQKVLLGREIDLNPQLLITSYPVRGLDIGASYFIYETLNKQKEKGVGILFIGEDLDVLLEIADRIMVMHDGKCMGIVDPRKITKEDIGLLMLGQGV